MRHQLQIRSRAVILGLVLSLIGMQCTLQDPISIKNEAGKITGRVFPRGAQINVKARQGTAIIATTTSDTSGTYTFTALNHGVYALDFTANNFGRYTEENITVYPGATTAVKDIALKGFPKQIEVVRPAPGQTDYPLEEIIQFQFCESMNRTTVENALSITPRIRYHSYWNFDNTQFTLVPEPLLLAATRYELVLSNQARTQMGTRLDFVYTFYFETAPVAIKRSIPLNYAAGVATNSSIFLNFNSMMNKTSVENSFQMIPPVAGNFNWVDNQSLLFTSGSYLAPGTEYLIKLDSLAEDIYGKRLVGTFKLSFQTEALRILSTYPQNGASYVTSGSHIVLTFNAEMDQSSVQNAWQIFPITAGKFQWENYATFRFVPESGFAPRTRYQVTINSNCQSISGKKIPATFQFAFTTIP